MKPCDCYHAGAKLESIPCGGCSFCSRDCQQWDRFSEDVDDVVPLALITTNPEFSDNVETMLAVDAKTEYIKINWGETRSKEDISRLLHEDGDFSVLFQWIESSSKQHDLLQSSPALRSYCFCRKQLGVKDGVIFYAWLFDSPKRLCLLVPKLKQEKVLYSCHDMKSSAHLGQDKTVQRAKQYSIWHRMSKNCR